MATTPKQKDVEIYHDGERILLPAKPKPMSYRDARLWLERKEAEEETQVRIIEKIEGYPTDCANALALAVKKLYGFNEKLSTAGFFGSTPPTFVNVPIDHLGNTAEVFVGEFAIPNVSGTFKTQPFAGGINIIAVVKQKHRPEVQRLAAEAREQLKINSLYRGKAIRISFEKDEDGDFQMKPPEFMAPYTGIQPRLNRETMESVEANLFTPIRHTAACRKAGIKLRRADLMYGQYGTGKTLVARVTADLCVKHNWTFAYCNTPEALASAFDFAKAMKSPCVIFCEDMDIIVEKNDTNFLQNMLDGVDTKHLEIILVLTTNHPDRIPPGLLRHGRVDAAIHFTPPNAETAELLVRDFAGSRLSPSENLSTVGAQLAGLKPAIIHGIVEGATLHALNLSEGADPNITAEALLASAASMADHVAMIEREAPKKVSLLEQGASVLGSYIAAGIMRAQRQGIEGFPDIIDEYAEKTIPAMNRMVEAE